MTPKDRELANLRKQGAYRIGRNEALDEVIALIESAMERQDYGHPLLSDPRKFRPDPECSTDEERAAHAEACKAWDAGVTSDLPPSWSLHETRESAVAAANGASSALVSQRDDGKWICHAHRTPWGLGTTTYIDEDSAWLADKVRAMKVEP